MLYFLVHPWVGLLSHCILRLPWNQMDPLTWIPQSNIILESTLFFTKREKNIFVFFFWKIIFKKKCCFDIGLSQKGHMMKIILSYTLKIFCGLKLRLFFSLELSKLVSFMKADEKLSSHSIWWGCPKLNMYFGGRKLMLIIIVVFNTLKWWGSWSITNNSCISWNMLLFWNSTFYFIRKILFK